MSIKELIGLSAGIGFFIIWILDLNKPVPAEIAGDFWNELLYHYAWLMYSVLCLFYFQYVRNIRLKSASEAEKTKGNSPQKPRSTGIKKGRKR